MNESRNIDTIDVLIEIPKGCRNKYEYDPATGHIRYDRMLFSSVQYPSDYGFIPETLAGDGDPLDALVIVWEPTFPGCLITCRPVGLFKMYDEKGPDEKILCVPINDPIWEGIRELDDVPRHLLVEMEHFFRIYKDLEKKKTGIDGWYNRDAALEVIAQARAGYVNSAKA